MIYPIHEQASFASTRRRTGLARRLTAVSLSVMMLAASSSCALEDGELEEDFLSEEDTEAVQQAQTTQSQILGGLVVAALTPGIKAGVGLLFPQLSAAAAKGEAEALAAKLKVTLNQAFIDYILADVASLFTSANQYPPPCSPNGSTNCTNGILIARQSTVDGIVLKANSAVEFLNATQYRSARTPASATLAAAAMAQSNFVMERHILTKLQATPQAQRKGHHEYLSSYSAADLSGGSTSLGAFCNTSQNGYSILSSVVWDVTNQARQGWSLRLECFGIGGSCFYKLWVLRTPEKIQNFPENQGDLARSEFNRQQSEYIARKLEETINYSAFKKVQQALYLRGRCEPQLSMESAWCRPAGELLRRGAQLFTFQADGNLVMYDGSRATWHSNTARNGKSVCVQPGKLYVKNAAGATIWSRSVTGAKMLTLGTVRIDKTGPYSVRFRDSAGFELGTL